jgi:hypothetical protein
MMSHLTLRVKNDERPGHAKLNDLQAAIGEIGRRHIAAIAATMRSVTVKDRSLKPRRRPPPRARSGHVPAISGDRSF